MNLSAPSFTKTLLAIRKTRPRFIGAHRCMLRGLQRRFGGQLDLGPAREFFAGAVATCVLALLGCL